ncbi:unnamed protein product [Ilex paraguariensis]|uniref:Cytochrome c oxidase subunit 6b-1 n=1 Tax=Ilex paraguariensis TaxID=185542 RepID=A0ABC8RYD5_9AQUA
MALWKVVRRGGGEVVELLVVVQWIYVRSGFGCETRGGGGGGVTCGCAMDLCEKWVWVVRASRWCMKMRAQYLLKGKENEEKLVLGPKPAEEEVKNPVSAASDEVVAQKTEEIPVSVESSEVSQAGAAEGGSEASDVATGKSTENAGESVSGANPAAEESGGSTDQETPVDQEESELSTEIKVSLTGQFIFGLLYSSPFLHNVGATSIFLFYVFCCCMMVGYQLETAPADFRFPTTNQTRHCFTRYVEYHRCVAAKGEGAPECDKFAKYYRSLCPGEWIDRWNEQRENGSFPGPL